MRRKCRSSRTPVYTVGMEGGGGRQRGIEKGGIDSWTLLRVPKGPNGIPLRGEEKRNVEARLRKEGTTEESEIEVGRGG